LQTFWQNSSSATAALVGIFDFVRGWVRDFTGHSPPLNRLFCGCCAAISCRRPPEKGPDVLFLANAHVVGARVAAADQHPVGAHHAVRFVARGTTSPSPWRPIRFTALADIHRHPHDRVVRARRCTSVGIAWGSLSEETAAPTAVRGSPSTSRGQSNDIRSRPVRIDHRTFVDHDQFALEARASSPFETRCSTPTLAR
jgi:hypothetical protein